MKQKVTIRDVAREAGVSTATVSYVMNNRTDQTISEEVRRKVLQIANLLNYKPNAFAKNLRNSPDAKLISVCSKETLSCLCQSEYMYFLKTLGSLMADDKYSLILSDLKHAHFGNVDAIITFNVDKSDFKEIAELNFVPLIAVDCMVNDQLFFQITTDYAGLRDKANAYFGHNYLFCTIPPADSGVKEDIKAAFLNPWFAQSFADLDKLTTKNVATDSAAICEYLVNKGFNVYFDGDLIKRKCQKVALCVDYALRRESFDVHIYKI